VPVGEPSKFQGDQNLAEKHLEKLLRSFYRKPFEIHDYKELESITALADYYCALPAFSAFLYQILPHSLELTAAIENDPNIFLVIAAKLRNETLFTESLVHAVNPWHSPRFRTLKDRRLRDVAEMAHGRISNLIMKGQEIVLYTQRNDASFREMHPSWTIITSVKGNDRVSWPRYIREMVNKLPYKDGRHKPLYQSCVALLEDNRMFNRYTHKAHEGALAEHILCAKIDKDEFPWDRAQTDY